MNNCVQTATLLIGELQQLGGQFALVATLQHAAYPDRHVFPSLRLGKGVLKAYIAASARLPR